MLANVIVPTLFAWHMHPGYVRPVRYYRITPDFCDSVRNHFYEDWILTWRIFQCRDIYTMIRHAFDAWQYNSDTVVYETHNTSGADVVIGTTTMDAHEWIAFSHSSTNETEIRVDLDNCWYTDRHFCYSVNRDVVPLSWGLSIIWALFICIAGFMCWRRPSREYSVPRILMWVVVLAVPMLATGSLIPCLVCHDFTAVVIHEVGHILGFGNSDDPSQMCGCGGLATPCAAREDDGNSVMHSVAQRRNTLCLSRDDVDGVRSIYGGVCDDPIWCYENQSTTGYTRVSTALLYSFMLASLVVFIRNRLYVRPHVPSRTTTVEDIAHPRTAPRGRAPLAQTSRSLPPRRQSRSFPARRASVHRI